MPSGRSVTIINILFTCSCTRENSRAGSSRRGRSIVTITRPRSRTRTRSFLSRSDDPAFRRVWRKRLVDHDGTPGDESSLNGGIAKWIALADATGLSREKVMAGEGILPAVRYAVDAYLALVSQKTFLEAVASSLTELFSKDLITLRVAKLRELYPWLSHGLQYFEGRLTQAPEDAAFALALRLRTCPDVRGARTGDRCAAREMRYPLGAARCPSSRVRDTCAAAARSIPTGRRRHVTVSAELARVPKLARGCRLKPSMRWAYSPRARRGVEAEPDGGENSEPRRRRADDRRNFFATRGSLSRHALGNDRNRDPGLCRTPAKTKGHGARMNSTPACAHRRTDVPLSPEMRLLLESNRAPSPPPVSSRPLIGARVFAEAADLGMLHAHLTGGEPLLHPELPEIIRAGKRAGLYVNLITSGMGLSAARLDEVIDCGVEHIQLSFQDSIEKESEHDLGREVARGQAQSGGSDSRAQRGLHHQSGDSPT